VSRDALLAATAPADGGGVLTANDVVDPLVNPVMWITVRPLNWRDRLDRL
jgi:hypothetical protein